MKKLPNEYYICEEFVTLAGPYNTKKDQDSKFLESVVADMKRGNINYRLVEKSNKTFVQRTGMIMPKAK